MTSTAGSPRDAAIPRALLRLAGGACYWMPVWIPLAVLAQVALLGLRPALAESRRLAGREDVLRARFEARVERRDELQALHQALGDPIYRERLRLERCGAPSPERTSAQ